eukprot:TRINITY_DN341_c0_g1_i3.p1 TRINITY_DN341_c0_g1~~TRINITY_DN341_c0_g1_i3.p1  ORF type:complete len:294 (+),score=51.28 TRINITY_DN341_c0_g1_i3:675-1556(+)
MAPQRSLLRRLGLSSVADRLNWNSFSQRPQEQQNGEAQQTWEDSRSSNEEGFITSDGSHASESGASRRVLGHLQVTVVQNLELNGQLYGGQQVTTQTHPSAPAMSMASSAQRHLKTFGFTVNEGPERILKLFMQVSGRNNGRQEKHLATAMVPISRAIATGSDMRTVQLIVQPWNLPVAMIQVILEFDNPTHQWDEASAAEERIDWATLSSGAGSSGTMTSLVLAPTLGAMPLVVISAGEEQYPSLAVPDGLPLDEDDEETEEEGEEIKHLTKAGSIMGKSRRAEACAGSSTA